MKIHFLCTRWGSDNLDFEVFADKAQSAGYEGIETGLPADEAGRNQIVKILKDRGMILIAQHNETRGADFAEHKAAFEKRLEHIAGAGPMLINSQTGRDIFTMEQNLELIEIARQVSEKTGVEILHETHRGRFSFALHVTREYIRKVDSLYLGLDISHWCCVAESLLADQEEAVTAVLERTNHLHARVGYAEGPQVTDPRAPEYAAALEAHLKWWDTALESAKKRGRKVFTITPEFGPIPYTTALPFTRMPVSSQWDINAYMKNLLSERYAS